MLPDKTIRLSHSLLGISALLLKSMRPDDTTSSLWERVKRDDSVNTYEKFIKGLVMLYSLGAVEFNGNRLAKVVK